MPIYLNTSGDTNLGIGLCARCSLKFPLGDLMPDPNYPGLMVCVDDVDQYDPYRLPARQTEQINLPFVRPDVSLNLSPTPEVDVVYVTEDNHLMISEDGYSFTVNP